MSVQITDLRPTTTQTHDVGGFSRITLRGLGTVEFVQGDREGVEVEAPANLHEHIKVRVDGDTLTVGLFDTALHLTTRGSFTLRFRVYGRSLRALESSGAGKIRTNHVQTDRLSVRCSGAGKIALGTVEATELTLEISGAGKLTADDVRSDTVQVSLHGAGKITADSLHAERFAASLSGAGRVTASGTADTADLSISGAGTMDLVKLRSRTARATLSGVGKAYVYASDALDAHVSGMGRIEYAGRPHDVRQSSSGFGKVVASTDS